MLLFFIFFYSLVGALMSSVPRGLMTFFLSLLVHSLAVYVVMATTAVPLPLSVIEYPRHLRSIAHRKYPYFKQASADSHFPVLKKRNPAWRRVIISSIALLHMTRTAIFRKNTTHPLPQPSPVERDSFSSGGVVVMTCPASCNTTLTVTFGFLIGL